MINLKQTKTVFTTKVIIESPIKPYVKDFISVLTVANSLIYYLHTSILFRSLIKDDILNWFYCSFKAVYINCY